MIATDDVDDDRVREDQKIRNGDSISNDITSHCHHHHPTVSDIHCPPFCFFFIRFTNLVNCCRFTGCFAHISHPIERGGGSVVVGGGTQTVINNN